MPNLSITEIAETELFKGIKQELLESLGLKDYIEFPEGDIIFKTGDAVDNMYVIADGIVKLKIQGGLSSPIVVKKIKGQHFGEIEILNESQRKSSAVAETRCTLLVLPKTLVNKLSDMFPDFRQNVSGTIKAPEGIRRRDIIFSENSEKISDIPFLKVDKINFNDPDDELRDSVNYEPETPQEIIPPIKNEVLLPPDSSELPLNPLEENIEIEPDTYDYSQSFSFDENIDKDELSSSPEPENFFLSDLDIPESTFPPEPEFPAAELPEEIKNKFVFSENDIPDENVNKFTFPEEDKVQGFNFASVEEPLKEEQEPHEANKIPGDETYLDILVAIQTIVSSIKTRDIFDNVAEAASELVKCGSAILYISDTQNNYLLDSSGNKYDKENSVPGICYSAKDILYNDDNLFIPVENKSGNISAVLQLNDKRNGEFSKQDEKIIKAVVPFIADVIENSRLLNSYDNDVLFNALGTGSRLLSSDIKRPLLMIRHYAEYLKQKNVDQDSMKILELISEQSASILELNQTVKEFSEGSIKINLIESEITLVMDEYLSLIAEYTDSRKVKVLRKYEGQGTALIDKRKLYQAIYQIVKNSCDSMPDGGKLYFIVRRNDPSLEIEIKDEGPGIPEEILPDITKPFFSYGKKEAAGLGLNIAEDIVAKHKGNLRYTSKSGEGTSFFITIPAADTF